MFKLSKISIPASSTWTLVVLFSLLSIAFVGIFYLAAHPAQRGDPAVISGSPVTNPYYYADGQLPDLDNCPGGPNSPPCFDEFGLKINCYNPGQDDENLNLLGNICDPASQASCADEDDDGYFVGGINCGQLDCNDHDPNIHPGAIEICDGLDNDCDRTADNGCIPSFGCDNYVLEFQWGTSGSGGIGEFVQTQGIAISNAGKVFVADRGNNRIQVFNPDGTGGFMRGVPDQPYGLTIGGPGQQLYITEFIGDRVQQSDLSGMFGITWGSSGTGNGEFRAPAGIAIDGAGTNIYVADRDNNRIQKFDSSGTYLDQWGGFGLAPGFFRSPYGVAVDFAGNNVYATDFSNHRVQQFNPEGDLIRAWGGPTSGSGDGQFNEPLGIAVDSLGDIYVADSSNLRWQKFNNIGVFIGAFSLPERPQYIAIAPAGSPLAGYVYVTSGFGNHIYSFRPECGGSGPPPSCNNDTVCDSPTENCSNCVADCACGGLDICQAGVCVPPASPICASHTFDLSWGEFGSGDGQFISPRGIAIDSNNDVYVVDLSNNRVQKFDDNGTYLAQWGGFGGGGGSFNWPHAIAIDSSNNIYVAEFGNGGQVQKFDFNHIFIREWGSFGNPHGVAIDSNDNVYVVDTSNFLIKKFDSDGVFITQWGQAGAAAGQFGSPRGIAIDSNDDVYVVDFSNNRIQKFDSAGGFIMMWGSLGSGQGDFSWPLDVAVDSNDDVYVVDNLNSRIQRFDSNGNFIAEWGSFGNGDGQFNWPTNIAIDLNNNVYVDDSNTHRVQKFICVP